MKYLLSAICILLLVTNAEAQEKVEWMSWDDAVVANKTTPKKMYVDIYTDWCGYCKKMDRETFTDPEVIKYLNTNFYPVKFDAEQKEEIIFNETSFKHKPGGRGGVHELAVALLNNRMGYPAFVILDETAARILISPGYKGPSDVMMEMKYANEELYKTKNWESYKVEQTAAMRAAKAKLNTAPATKPSSTNTTNATKAGVNVNKPTAATNASKPTSAENATKQAAASAKNVTVNKTKMTASQTAAKATPSKPSSPNEEVFKVVEEMPRFPGCEDSPNKETRSKCAEDKMLQYIYQNLKYPSLARENSIDGMVVVQFKIGTDGKIFDTVVITDIGQGCGDEAARVVRSMPNWIPGMQRGKPVNVLYTLPVRFKLESKEDKKQKRKNKKAAKANG